MRTVAFVSAAAAVLVAGVLWSSHAQARSSVAVVEHENIAVTTGSGKPATADRVKQAITEAAASTKYKWTIANGDNGALIATTLVRGKHTVAVNVIYSATQYSITYRSSENMNFDMDKGVAKIHPYYNTWVQQFVDAINAKLHNL